MLMAASALAPAVADDFKYTDEQFADIQMLRYKVAGFDQLSLRQKTLVYYLSEAALQGRDILFDQNGRYNLRIRRLLEAVYTDYKGDRDSDFYRALTVYLKRVWFSNGIHHHYGSEKFVPGFTEADLRAAVRRRNRLRAAQLEMFALQANRPAAMSGVDLMSTMFAGTFSFDIGAYTQQLEQKVAKLREAYDAGERPVAADAKRILITGCPVGGVINKIGRTIESNGGVVVCMDDCSGERTAAMMIDRRLRYPARHRDATWTSK